jgi:hypothetical protein
MQVSIHRRENSADHRHFLLRPTLPPKASLLTERRAHHMDQRPCRRLR